MKRLDLEIDRIAQSCVAVRLRMLSRFISRLYDEQLRPMGLRVSQLNILVVSGKLGTARAQQVCELLSMDESTLSRNVERMRAQGWLDVVPNTFDGRTQPFHLTRAGRDLLSRAVPACEKAQARAERLLGAEGVESLRKAVVATRTG